MSTKANPALDRRSAMRFGAVGAATTAAVVAGASTADAAAGQAVLQGRVNTPGATDTSIIAPTAGIAFTVKNTGMGAAGYFFASNGNGFAGGTSAAGKFGLSTANTATTAGSGAAMGAVGVNNSGVLANTKNLDRFAVEAVNLSTVGVNGEGGGLYAEGGEVPAVVALSNVGVPAVISVGDTIYVEGHEVVLTANAMVWGATSANGPEVSFSGYASLDFQGNTTVDLNGPTFYNGAQWSDVGNTANGQFVTPVTGPMPNLWMRTSEAGTVTITGGTPGGTVAWRVLGVRNDVAGTDFGRAGRAAGGSRLAKGKELAARVLKRAGRG